MKSIPTICRDAVNQNPLEIPILHIEETCDLVIFLYCLEKIGIMRAIPSLFLNSDTSILFTIILAFHLNDAVSVLVFFVNANDYNFLQ